MNSDKLSYALGILLILGCFYGVILYWILTKEVNLYATRKVTKKKESLEE